MNYLINFFTIFSGTTGLLIGQDRMSYMLLLLSGLAIAVILWLVCAFFGRLFYKPYRMSIGQHILCSILAVIVTLTVPTYASTVYLQPALVGVIAYWRDTLASSKAWQDKQFKREYAEIKKMGLEDFSSVIPPEKGGSIIPLNHAESRIKIGQMEAEAAIENFQFNFSLISKIIGTQATVSANMVSQDMNHFFKSNPGATYPLNRGVQLAVERIYQELEPQIPRIIFITRLALIFLVVIGYAICLGWIAYAALKQIRIHSAHTLHSNQ